MVFVVISFALLTLSSFGSFSYAQTVTTRSSTENSGSEVKTDRVKVTAYYETLCPDSIAFIRSQLWPAYQDIGEIMDIELVPYGKAAYEEHTDGTVAFRCQHGSRECHGNTVQACALNIHNQDTEIVLPFVHCMQSQRYPDRSGQMCAERHNLTWSKLRDCAAGAQGQQHLLAMGKKTESLEPKLNFVPWINFNDVHTDSQHDTAQYNLVRVVCEAYNGSNVPSKCEPFVATTEQGQGHTVASNTETGNSEEVGVTVS